MHQSNLVTAMWQHASLRSIQRELGLVTLWDCLYVFQSIQDDEPDRFDLWQFDDSEEEIAKIQVTSYLILGFTRS